MQKNKIYLKISIDFSVVVNENGGQPWKKIPIIEKEKRSEEDGDGQAWE